MHIASDDEDVQTNNLSLDIMRMNAEESETRKLQNSRLDPTSCRRMTRRLEMAKPSYDPGAALNSYNTNMRATVLLYAFVSLLGRSLAPDPVLSLGRSASHPSGPLLCRSHVALSWALCRQRRRSREAPGRRGIIMGTLEPSSRRPSRRPVLTRRASWPRRPPPARG